MTLPVRGGILGNALDPTMLANIQAIASQQQAAPAPAPAAPPPIDVGATPPPAQIDTHMPEAVAALPGAGVDIQKPRGILGSIGDKLHDPEFRAEALRFAMGAMAPGSGGGLGGLSNGILAATQFHQQRRSEAEDARRYEEEMGFKRHGQDLQAQEINNNYALGHEGHVVQSRGQDLNYQVGHEGNLVQDRSSIRSNATSRANNITDNSTARANNLTSNETERRGQNISAETTRRGQDIGLTASKGDNAATVAAAAINSGQHGALKPDDAMAGLASVLPGLLGTNDSEGVGKAVQADPDLQARLIDAYTKGYGNGGEGAAERAVEAVKGVLGGATYTDDNSSIPFYGSPEITVPKQGNGGKTVVRTGTDKSTGKKVVQYSDGSISYAD